MIHLCPTKPFLLNFDLVLYLMIVLHFKLFDDSFDAHSMFIIDFCNNIVMSGCERLLTRSVSGGGALNDLRLNMRALHSCAHSTAFLFS